MRIPIDLCAALRLALPLAGLALALQAVPALADDARLRADLEILARRTVYFGHQSVGDNLLEGLRGLSAQAGVPLRIARLPSAVGVAPGTLAHDLMPENGDPVRKLESFERALGSDPAGGPELALLKFCFVDVTPSTDVQQLWSRYQATLARLRAAHPRTTFVHATIPLTGVQGGWKGTVKRLLGRAPYGLAENAKREEYNALLRQAYEGKEPLFDVARIESTRPDGTGETADWKGRAVPAMVPAYTDDGGHLGPEGQRRVARQLAALLAAVPVRAAPEATR